MCGTSTLNCTTRGLWAGIYTGLSTGHADSQNSLAKCFHAHNAELAVEYFSKAAQQGHSMAAHNLATCYYSGNGVERDHAKARSSSLSSLPPLSTPTAERAAHASPCLSTTISLQCQLQAARCGQADAMPLPR